jgi:2,4-diketo-3-deoxy-L-fuconate hydrolase
LEKLACGRFSEQLEFHGDEVMKITAFRQGDRTVVGVVDAEGGVRTLDEIETFWRDPQGKLSAGGGEAVGSRGDIDERPAVPPSAKVICVGLNYRLHAIEAKLPIPEVPVIFSRWASTLTTDGRPTPQVEEKFDWEGELGAVIGRRMFRVSAEQAMRGIFGYVAFNDLSARSFQVQTPQWTMGKNSPASGPMSPIVTCDEVGDPAKGLRLTTQVNGELMQDSTTADMIFNVPAVIAFVSQVIELAPGDLIITGTPSGVGFATGRFLKPGDEVVVEIERIGRVRTPIVAAPASIA